MCLPRPCSTLPTWPLLEVKAGPKAIKSSPPCYGIDMPSFTNVCGWGPWIHTLHRRGREQSLCKETFETAPWGPNSKLYQKKEGNQQEVCVGYISEIPVTSEFLFQEVQIQSREMKCIGTRPKDVSVSILWPEFPSCPPFLHSWVSREQPEQRAHALGENTIEHQRQKRC